MEEATVTKLRPDHWAWIRAKLLFVVWAIMFVIFTPSRVEDIIGKVLVYTIGIAIIGGIALSLYGLYKSRSLFQKVSDFGVRMEISGLWMAMGGPISYAVVQGILAIFDQHGWERIPLIVLALIFVAFLHVRIVMIKSHRKRSEPR